MMFKIIFSIALLACYSLAKSVDLPNDQLDLSMDDSQVPDLSEVIREVENIQETFLRSLSEEMKKIDGKLQKIRDRHDEEMKHFGQEPALTPEEPSLLGGEKEMSGQEFDSKMPTDSVPSEEDLRRGGKQVEPKLTETLPGENLPKETPETVHEPEKVIIEVRVPVLPEVTEPEKKEPIGEPQQPDLGGVKEFREDFSSTTPKSLEQIIEEVKETLEKVEPEDNKLESEEQNGEQESAEKHDTIVEKEKKVSSSESDESSEEKPDLITAPSGSSIIISVPTELQGEGKVNVEIIPAEGQEFLNPQPDGLRLGEYSTETPVVTKEVPDEETTTQFTTETPVVELTTVTKGVPVEETTTQFTTETPREETTTEELKSSTEGSLLLPSGNTIIVSLSTGPPQLEKNKEIVIDIEIPKGPSLDENVKTLPTDGRSPLPTTDRPNPMKTTRRPTDGKKRPSGKRCPIGYQFNIYTLECTIPTNYAAGYGTYFWSMSQPPSSLTQNNPFMNFFGLRK